MSTAFTKIEFIKVDSKYYISQMFLACNQMGSDEAYEYVASLIA